MRSKISSLLITILLFALSSTQNLCAQEDGNKILTDALDEVLNAYERENLFMGSIAIELEGEKLYQRSAGYADQRRKVENSDLTSYNIGSLTMSMTRVIVLQLVKDGVLALNDPISKYLEIFNEESKQGITIRQLLTHKSGFGDYRNSTYKNNIQNYRTVQLMLNLKRSDELLYNPGSDEFISNYAYVVLGAIIEKVTGKTFAQNIDSRIITPLGLQKTFFSDRRGTLPKSIPHTISVLEGNPAPIKIEAYASPDQGVYSTCGDMLTYYKELMYSQKLLNDDSKLEYLNLIGSRNRGARVLGKLSYMESGSGDGLNSFYMRNDENDFGLVVLSNAEAPIAEELGERLAEILLGKQAGTLKYRQAYVYKTYKSKGLENLESDWQSISDNVSSYYDKPDILCDIAAELLSSQNMAADAMDLLKLNNRLYPGHSRTINMLGQAMYTSGSSQEAIDFFEKALEQDPDNMEAKEILSKLKRRQ